MVVAADTSPCAAAAAPLQRRQASPARKLRAPVLLSSSKDESVALQKPLSSRLKAGSMPPATSSSSTQPLTANFTSNAVDAPKRAISTERRRPSTQSKTAAKASTPLLLSKQPSSNGLFSSLRADSALSLSNAGLEKREEARDQTLRPAGNAVHPMPRKGTPVRERKPVVPAERKGTPTPPSKRPTAVLAENAQNFEVKPISRRWPGGSNGKGAPALSRSMDLSSQKASVSLNQLAVVAAAAAATQDQGGSALRSVSCSSSLQSPLPQLIPKISKPTNRREGGGVKAKSIVPTDSIVQSQEVITTRAELSFEEAQLANFDLPPFPLNNFVRISRLSLGGAKPGTNSSPVRGGGVRGYGQAGIQVPAKFLQNASSKSRQHSENEVRPKPESFSTASAKDHLKFTESASNSKDTRNLISAFTSISSSLTSPRLSQPTSPSVALLTPGMPKQDKYVRVFSPSHSRGTSPTRKQITSSHVPPFFRSSLDYGLDSLKDKKAILNQQEEAHFLRILQNRLLQWHFANARAKEAMKAQKAVAEKALVNIWLKTFDLQTSVAMQRIKLQKARDIQRLESLLSAQKIQLEHWDVVQKEHVVALDAVTEALEASTLRIPLTGGSKADLKAIREAVSCAVDVMNFIEPSARSLLTKGEKIDALLAELATIAMDEKTLVYECSHLVATVASLEMEECSLRAHVLQIENEKCRV